MKKVFVSGCYDILHAGHIQFFTDAKALGDHLTVCFASSEVLAQSKKRKSSLPDDNKMILIGALSCVDAVVKSSDLDPVFDFRGHFMKLKPDILAVTEDDKNVALKKDFCKKYGAQLVVLKKRNVATQVSTTKILAGLKNREELPLRVDFAGGWLDVPRFSRKGAFIVNCSISPLVSLENWPYEQGSGLGGSAAHTLLQIRSGIESELLMGVGWQDPAIISETGLCVWRSGKNPVLDAKFDPQLLSGKMLILWTGSSHNTPEIAGFKRNFDAIEKAGTAARKALYKNDLSRLAHAVTMTYKTQIAEGMKVLPKIPRALACKYVGSGHGGYALYIFASKNDRDGAVKKNKNTKAIEPYIKPVEY